MTKPEDPCPEQASLRCQLVLLQPRLHRRALRLCRNVQDAADLVGDTTERALRFEHHFVSGSNAHAWLQQIMYSVFVTRFRRQRAERRVTAQLPGAQAAQGGASAAPSQPWLLPSFADEINALPRAYRDVVVLVDVGEHSYKEAAEALAIPVGTVMSRVHRARISLRQRLTSSLVGGADAGA